jgi:hypothetical protein
LNGTRGVADDAFEAFRVREKECGALVGQNVGQSRW